MWVPPLAGRGANRSKSHLGNRPGGVVAAVQKSVVWGAPWRNGKECLSAFRIAWVWSQGQSRSALTLPPRVSPGCGSRRVAKLLTWGSFDQPSRCPRFSFSRDFVIKRCFTNAARAILPPARNTPFPNRSRTSRTWRSTRFVRSADSTRSRPGPPSPRRRPSGRFGGLACPVGPPWRHHGRSGGPARSSSGCPASRHTPRGAGTRVWYPSPARQDSFPDLGRAAATRAFCIALERFSAVATDRLGDLLEGLGHGLPEVSTAFVCSHRRGEHIDDSAAGLIVVIADGLHATEGLIGPCMGSVCMRPCPSTSYSPLLVCRTVLPVGF